MRKIRKTNDEAVSPVVGVMLMLVVTIIIAAVVSGFAGGLAGTQQKAPQASIAIKTGYGMTTSGTGIDKTVFDISFEHQSGDPINTKDIQIITYLTLPNGTIVQHKQTSSSAVARVSSTGPKYARLPFLYDTVKVNTTNLYYTAAQVDTGLESVGWFGKTTLMPGQLMRTYKKDATAAFLGLIPDSSIYPVDAVAYTAGSDLLEQCIQNQTQLEVKMLHVPSGKFILDKKINLQG